MEAFSTPPILRLTISMLLTGPRLHWMKARPIPMILILYHAATKLNFGSRLDETRCGQIQSIDQVVMFRSEVCLEAQTIFFF